MHTHHCPLFPLNAPEQGTFRFAQRLASWFLSSRWAPELTTAGRFIHYLPKAQQTRLGMVYRDLSQIEMDKVL